MANYASIDSKYINEMHTVLYVRSSVRYNYYKQDADGGLVAPVTCLPSDFIGHSQKRINAPLLPEKDVSGDPVCTSWR